MAEACKHSDCILSVWPEAKDYCFFHEPQRDAIIARNSGNSLYNALQQYLLIASNPGHNPSQNGCLTLATLRIDAGIAKAFPVGVSRSLEFANCVFEGTDILSGRTFGQAVYFRDCTFLRGDNEAQLLIVEQCQFHGGISINSKLHVVFKNCAFRGFVTIGGELGASLDGGRLESAPIQVDCKGDIRIRDIGTVSGSLEFSEGTRVIEIANCKLLGEAIVRVSHDNRDIRLINVVIGARLLVTSNSIVDCPIPTIILDDVLAPSQFDCPKLSFRNIGVGKVSGRGLRFSGSLEIENVHFEHSWSRKVFAAERETRLPLIRFVRFQHRLERLQRWREDYRWLKAWYGAHADHQTANAFYASEMFATWKVEVSRASLLRAIWKRYFSFDAWYCRLSNFGQSVIRPLGWVVAWFVITAVLVTWLGMYVDPDGENTLRTVNHSVTNGLEFALRSFAFWFRPEGRPYLAPATTVGWIAGLVQQSFTLVAGTFFLLALRRRFKR